MYIQITTKCNMECSHCGFNCTKNGEHMSLSTWKKVLKWQGDDHISIGGGEPTIHPHFWRILGEAIAEHSYVWLATNGSKTNTALALAKMAKKGIIGCALSLDDYHEPISQKVVNAFTKTRKTNWGESDPDCREIRNVQRIIASGRAWNWGEEGCVCEEIIVKPWGEIKACGCDDAPSFGTIENPQIPSTWEHGNCWKNQEDE